MRDGETPLRRILLLLALVVVLAGVILLNNAAANWHYVVSGAPGTLLYAASFDGGAADGFNGEWAQYDGRLAAQITNGVLRLSDSNPSGDPFSVASPRFADFDLHVTVRYAAGPEIGGLEDGFGVIFRLQDKGNDAIGDNDYYLFLISSDGYYRVIRRFGGERRVLSEWIDTPLINTGVGATNNLRVTAQGSEFAFYINGERVPLCIPDDPNALSTYSGGQCFGGTMQETLVDTSIADGQLGGVVIATEGGAPEVAVEFDQFVVYAPETPSARGSS
jgi:hypothetical protein